MTRREQFVLLFLGVTIAIGASVTLWLNRDTSPVPVAGAEAPLPARPASPPPDAPIAVEPAAAPVELREVVVSLRGAVASPGVYRLPEGARVVELIEEGGGLLEDADTDDINLAAALIDGTTLHVPSAASKGDGDFRGNWVDPNPAEYTIRRWRSGETASAAPPGFLPAEPGTDLLVGAVRHVPGARLDLNRATAVELQGLPGIGPVISAAIVQFRTRGPYRRVEDLLEVPGIGEKRLESIRGLVTVGPGER